MGSSKSSLIGPYARVKIPIIKEEEKKTYPSCSNPSCPEHKVRVTTKFCGSCSALVTESEKTLYIERRLNFWDLLYNLGEEKAVDGLGEPMDEDSFRGFDKSYYLDGFEDDDMVIFHEDSSIYMDESGVFEFEAYDSIKKLEEFKNRIKPLIDRLVKMGAPDTATYHFGGVTYWS